MNREKARGVIALLLGATGIGFAPIFVRLSEVGPVSTGFYRIALAQPILWWILYTGKKPPGEEASRQRSDLWYAALAGFCFAGDLSVWHWSIKLTTIANSTLLTNLAPVFVTFGGALFFKERVTPRLILGMLFAFVGGFLLVAESLHLERRFLIGDGLAVTTAVFYSGYLLAVKKLRATKSVWYVMAWAGVFTMPLLWGIGFVSRESMVPISAFGWMILLGLALLSHIGGQGMIAYGLAHISAGVSSVLLMWQPVVAALLGFLILHEPITKLRALGGLIIITGILAATWRPAVGMDKDLPTGGSGNSRKTA